MPYAKKKKTPIALSKSQHATSASHDEPACSRFHRQALQQGRNQKQGHSQRNSQVYHHHHRKIGEIHPLLFLEEKDDNQGPHGGERSSQHRQKSAPVAMVSDVIGHYYGIVDNQIGRASCRERV